MGKEQKRIIPRMLRWLPAAAVVVGIIIIFPGIFAYLGSQDELISDVRGMLDKSITRISLQPERAGRDADLCFVTESQDEISRIVDALRGVSRQLTQGTARRDPFVVTLRFADESRANLVLYRRADDLSRAHLERIEYTRTNNVQPGQTGDIGFEFPEIGAWAATVMSRNSCSW